MKASEDAIKTAIMFLTVGLKPNPVALSSIFAAKSADNKVSTSASFALANVSIPARFLSKYLSPSKTIN